MWNTVKHWEWWIPLKTLACCSQALPIPHYTYNIHMNPMTLLLNIHTTACVLGWLTIPVFVTNPNSVASKPGKQTTPSLVLKHNKGQPLVIVNQVKGYCLCICNVDLVEEAFQPPQHSSAAHEPSEPALSSWLLKTTPIPSISPIPFSLESHPPHGFCVFPLCPLLIIAPCIDKPENPIRGPIVSLWMVHLSMKWVKGSLMVKLVPSSIGLLVVCTCMEWNTLVASYVRMICKSWSSCP